MALGDTTLKRNQFAEHLRGLEQQRSSTTNLQEAAQMEEVIKGLKLQLNETTAAEQQQMTRESELAGQLQKAQNDIADSRARIAEMERMLDAAIQQLLKGK